MTLASGAKQFVVQEALETNFQARIVFLMINSHHKHGCIRRWSRDYNLLSASRHVHGGFLRAGEASCRLHNVFSTSICPFDGGGVTFVEDSDLLSVDVEELTVFFDLTLELTMGGVVLEHVDHVVKRNEGVVDCHDRCTLLYSSTKDKATDTAKAIDSNPRGGHCHTFTGSR